MNALKFALTAAALLVSNALLAQQLPGRPQQDDMRINAAARTTLIDGVVRELNKGYVFPEQAKKVEAALRQHQKRGDYDSITSAEKFSSKISEDMQSVTHDKHLRMFYSQDLIPQEDANRKPSAEQQAQELAGMKSQNFGIERLERLPFNIGYLGLNGFAPAKASADSLGAAMTVLANTDVLIIDLRRNGGGDPATVAMLASYFLDERTRLNDIYYRNGDNTEQMWSSDFVKGTRYGQQKDVYILTSKDTFSAAEDFSYTMKNLKRATIVGETTGGGAHPGDVTRLDEHFAMFVPNGRSISPVTKTDWEGVGVTPDVASSAGDAMKTAQVAILKKIAAGEKNPGRLARLTARIVAVEADNGAH
ncbi:MAG: S41 family peptidase [Massilia sp.]